MRAYGSALVILMFTGHHPLRVKGGAAALANIPMNGTVQLKHAFRARHLMQAVDILRHHRAQHALALQLGKLEMALVGSGIQRDHLGAVKLIKLAAIGNVEAVGQDGLGRIGELLVVQAVLAAEIRNTARRRHARATKEHHARMRLKQLGQLL